MDTNCLVLTTPDELRDLIRKEVSVLVPEPEERVTTSDFDWMSNRDFLTDTGLSKTTAQRYRASGLLPYTKLGSNVFYRKADVEALLEKNLRLPSEEVSK